MEDEEEEEEEEEKEEVKDPQVHTPQEKQVRRVRIVPQTTLFLHRYMEICFSLITYGLMAKFLMVNLIYKSNRWAQENIYGDLLSLIDQPDAFP